MKHYIVYNKKESSKIVLQFVAKSDIEAISIALNHFRTFGMSESHVKKHFKIGQV